MKEDKKFNNKSAKKSYPLAGQNIQKLANLRIIQKHLVYVIGLSSSIASKEVSLLIVYSRF